MYFRDLKPSHVEEKLKEREKWKVHLSRVLVEVVVKILSAHQTRKTESVDGNCYDLDIAIVTTTLG